MTLHLTAASVLGRDETAVFIGGETVVQKRRKENEEKRSKERRKCEKKGKIAGQRKKGGKKGEQPLAAMGSEFEVDKERNMGNHR